MIMSNLCCPGEHLQWPLVPGLWSRLLRRGGPLQPQPRGQQCEWWRVTSNCALCVPLEYFISLQCAELHGTGMQLKSILVSHRGKRGANVHFISLCITNNGKYEKYLFKLWTFFQSYPSFWPENQKSKKYGQVFTVEYVSHNHYPNIR